MQEYAFGSCMERVAERYHINTKMATTRGLRYAKPAMACARQRKVQIETMLEDPQDYDVACTQLSSRSICTRLLQHMMNPDAVKRLTTAENQSRDYGYAAEDHFPENRIQRDMTLALADSRAKCMGQPSVAVTK